MSPPGRPSVTELGVEHINTASNTELATRKQQMRFLIAHLGITRPQAAALIRAYELDQRDERRNDARSAAREEFRAWFTRRGDLLIVRSKAKREWAVRS